MINPATGSRAPSLRAIYIFRREDGRSVANLGKIASTDPPPGVTFTIVDKSLQGALTHIEELSRRNFVRILRRPRDETQFASLSACATDEVDWVIQMHDDDTWSGVPDPRHLSPKWACHWARTSVQGEPSDQAVSLPSVFFGAIRQDVWSAFIDFVQEQPHPCPGVDQVIVFWCRELGISGPIPDYVYCYDSSNWAHFEAVLATNRVLAGATGWGELSDNEAMQWTVYLDTLTSLVALSQFTGAARAREIAKGMLRRTPPFAIGGFAGGIVNRLPAHVRRAVVETRGEGRTYERLKAVVMWSLHHRPNVAPPMIHEGLGPTTLKRLDQAVLSQLASCDQPWIVDRARVWHEQLVRLEQSIM